jgi:hypothetical protein
MPNWCHNRLTVIGPKERVKRLRDSDWAEALSARLFELLENSPTHFASQFDTEAPAVEPVKRLSRHWPGLTFILHYQVEASRIMGLLKVKGGRLTHRRVHY